MPFMDDLKQFFGGRQPNDKIQQLSNLTYPQQGLQNAVLARSLWDLARPINTSFFNPIEAQARRNFSQNTIPGIAERFTAMGGQGGQNGSGFQQALANAGADLESQLAAQRGQFGMQAESKRQDQLANLLALGLKPSFKHMYGPEDQEATRTLNDEVKDILSNPAESEKKLKEYLMKTKSYLSGKASQASDYGSEKIKDITRALAQTKAGKKLGISRPDTRQEIAQKEISQLLQKAPYSTPTSREAQQQVQILRNFGFSPRDIENIKNGNYFESGTGLRNSKTMKPFKMNKLSEDQMKELETVLKFFALMRTQKQ